MKKTLRLTGAALTGVAGGVAAVFLLCVATAAVALTTGNHASVPGLFSAWTGAENGAVALEFQPDGVGLLVVVAGCALLSALLAARRHQDTRGVEGSR